MVENGMDMNIFDYMRSNDMEKEAPLAARMRPRTLDEVAGQEHIIGKDKLLYRAIQADKISSVIFYGPPGTGKTTLAKVIASTTSAEFTQINATVAGKKDMEEVVAKAKEIQGMYGVRGKRRSECTASEPSFSSMRFTASTRLSRTICCPSWKTEP